MHKIVPVTITGMTKEERQKAILNELDEIAQVDRSISQPRLLNSFEPVADVPYEALAKWGDRLKRRQELHEELRKLASE